MTYINNNKFTFKVLYIKHKHLKNKRKYNSISLTRENWTISAFDNFGICRHIIGCWQTDGGLSYSPKTEI